VSAPIRHIKSAAALTDEELLNEFKKNFNQEVLAQLYLRYTDLVYGVCMKYLKNEEESRDAVINIFEKLLVSLKKYEIKNFTTWIHSVARNYCFALLQQNKKKMNHQAIPIDIETDDMIADPSAYEEEQLKALELRNLEEAMHSLNTEQKTCIELFYLEKYCYEEITEKTGYTLNQVKSYIQNGKRNLKIYLTGRNERFA